MELSLDYNDKDFGRKLRDFLNKRRSDWNMDMLCIADRCGISRSTISDIILGHSEVLRFSTLSKLCQGCEVCVKVTIGPDSAINYKCLDYPWGEDGVNSLFYIQLGEAMRHAREIQGKNCVDLAGNSVRAMQFGHYERGLDHPEFETLNRYLPLYQLRITVTVMP